MKSEIVLNFAEFRWILWGLTAKQATVKGFVLHTGEGESPATTGEIVVVEGEDAIALLR